MKITSFLFIVLLFSCTTRKGSHSSSEDFSKKASYAIDFGGCGFHKTMSFRKMSCGLYADSIKGIYFLTFDRSDETGKSKPPVFIRRFPNDCYGDEDSTFELSKTIDTLTFHSTGVNTYADKKNSYVFVSNSNGGQFFLNHIDTLTYTLIGKGFYKANDGHTYIKTQSLISPPENYGPMHYRLVPDIDVETYNTYGEIDGYAIDKTHVYWRRGTTDGDFIKTIPEAEAKSFVVIEKRTLGKDRRHVFYQENIVVGMNPDSVSTFADYERLKQK